MSTRYVWKKYTYTQEDKVIPNTYSSTISVYPIGSLTLCTMKPTRNADGTYSPAGYKYKIESDDPVIFNTNRVLMREYIYAVKEGENFYYKPGYDEGVSPSSPAYNYTYQWYSEGTNKGILQGYNPGTAVVGSSNLFIAYSNKWQYTTTTGSLVGNVSSNSQSAYKDGISGEYYYIYQGSDNIDPTFISYVTSANVGDSVTVSWGVSTSDKYGGTITYIVERSVNSGNWEKWDELTSTAIGIKVNSAGTRKFRVYAKDNYGFTSTTYATGPLLTVYGQLSVSLSASPSAGGTVSGGGSYSKGESVTITASPNSGYTFSHWLEGSSTVSTSSSYKFTLNANRSLTAVFTKEATYTVSVSASPSAGGSVSGGGSYSKNSSVTVYATPYSGYYFTGWYENSSKISSSTSYSFTVTSNRTFQARFSNDPTDPNITGDTAAVYVGINNVAKKCPKIYVGVNGIAHKVKKGYVGINGKARLFYKEPWVGTWLRADSPETSYNFRKIVYGNDKFVAVTIGYKLKTALYSTDGINWNTSIFSDEIYVNDLVYGNGKFVAIGDNTTTGLYSTNGINWYTFQMPAGAWSEIAYGNNKFVLGSTDENTAYSTDGINWTTSKFPNSNGFGLIAAGGGKFIAVSPSTSQIAYSTDGINWSAYNVLPSKPWSNIKYLNGKFYLTSHFQGDNESAIYYSTDGLSWTRCVVDSSCNWKAITYGNGKFVAVYGGTMFASLETGSAYSTDGINWEKIGMWSPTYSSGRTTWEDIAYGNGKFVATSFNGSNFAYMLA